MTKIDIFSGFLGAGKTTLIKKLIKEAYKNEKLVLIENEFGTIGIDGEFLKDSGIKINELNSGCICCSLVGDFSKALNEVINEFSPDRILIEPSGVGKLSDVIRAVEDIDNDDIVINALGVVIDANKCKMYMKNFGEFFNDQIENAGCIVLSHTDNITDDKLNDVMASVKEHNKNAVIISTPWEDLSGEKILMALEKKDTLENDINSLSEKHEHCTCGHHHHHDEECDSHHHEHDNECCCHHEHEHEENCECHHHQHEHEHKDGCGCHHHHHHEHDENCKCHEHHHEHHYHHADEVFTSCGIETAKKYTPDQIKEILEKLDNEEEYGMILRAKGIVETQGKEWIHFDYIPNCPDIRFGSASVCGRICVIGSKINEEKIKALFN